MVKKTKRCVDYNCPLIKSPVEVKYEGNLKANIVVIGESPGRQELKANRPFIGGAGTKIKQLVIGAGLRWDNMFIMNSARCMIQKDQMTSKQITKTLACCRKNVTKVLHRIKPKVIVCLGDFALRQIMKRSGITKSRGKWLFSKEFNCWILPTFHPAYLMRNEAMTPMVEQDLTMLVDFIKSGFVHTHDVASDTKSSEVEDILPLLDGAKRISIDTETQGKDWTSPEFGFLSYSVSVEPGAGYHVQLQELCPIDEADFTVHIMQKVNGKKKSELIEVGIKRCPGFEKKMEDLRIILENKNLKKDIMTPYDLHVFHAGYERYDMDVPKIKGIGVEIQAAAQLVEENLFGQASLRDLQFAFTDYKADYDAEFGRKFDKAAMVMVPREELVPYACQDADVTRRVADSLIARLKHPSNHRLANYLVKFVVPTITKALLTMEKNGVHIDLNRLPDSRKKIADLQALAEATMIKSMPKKVFEKYKDSMKFTKRDIILDVLFSKDGFSLTPIKKTDGGDSWSVDKETRLLLQDNELSAKAEQFIKAYDEWSECDTMLTRYLKGFEKSVKTDGKIHTKFSIAKTVTGRLSSSDPNMQNNPKRSALAPFIRQLIVPTPGYILMAADESQAELRWLAELSRDPEMMKCFIEGFDIHTATAISLSGRNWEDIAESEQKILRRNSKAINFGLAYLMQAPGFKRHVKKEYSIDITVKEAEKWMEVFFGKYLRVPNYHRSMIEICREFGYVETPIGRRRRLPEITSNDKRLKSEAERQAVNHPIQGISSDIVLMAANEILDAMKKKKIPESIFRLVLFVHDELIFELREDKDPVLYGKLIRHYMEHPPLKRDFEVTMTVPLKAEVKIGRNLAEMEDLVLD